jgi:peptidyl-prolyl cis-trans isomerase C
MGLILSASALAMALACWAPVSEPQVIDRVLARVGDRVITLSDTRAAITLGMVESAGGADPIAEALRVLIDRELALAEANRYAAPAPAPAAVDARVAEIRRRFTSEAEWQDALEAAALTSERLRDAVRDSLRAEAYVDQLLANPSQPTDDEVTRYYEQHRADFVRDGRQLSLDEARDLARERATTARRQTLVTNWLGQLRDRTTVVQIYRPVR